MLDTPPKPRIGSRFESGGKPMSNQYDAHVLIVGGGATGAGLAHDLALRGLRVTLVDRGELTCGTTGRHHGLLHSGARYAVGDREAGSSASARTRS